MKSITSNTFPPPNFICLFMRVSWCEILTPTQSWDYVGLFLHSPATPGVTLIFLYHWSIMKSEEKIGVLPWCCIIYCFISEAGLTGLTSHFIKLSWEVAVWDVKQSSIVSKLNTNAEQMSGLSVGGTVLAHSVVCIPPTRTVDFCQWCASLLFGCTSSSPRGEERRLPLCLWTFPYSGGHLSGDDCWRHLCSNMLFGSA